jgi:hypothetical protein
MAQGHISLSRGYKRCERARARESERERVRPLLVFSRYAFVCLFVFSLAPLSSFFCPPPPRGALDTPFYRCKEMPSYTMGCSWELTWLAGKCPEPCTDNNMAVGGRLEPCRGSIVAVGEVP